MGQVIRVSLPGYNALTDNDPDHFALYSDEDWVLIKELTRGTVSANDSGYKIYYPLDYIPTIFVYYQESGIWRSLTGQYFDSSVFPGIVYLPYVIMIPGEIGFYGNSTTPTNFKYFICYDNNQT